MIVNGTIVTPRQISTATSAMQGEFTKDMVFDALCAANVSWSIVGKTAARILRNEMDRGTIRPLGLDRYARVA